MNIKEIIKKVRCLEQDYLRHKYIASDQNSIESIETFGKWHSAASVLFSLANLEEDSNFKKFQEENTGGNAYVLSSIYDIIHSSYEILMAKVDNNIDSPIVESNDTKAPLIFISHSSEDKETVKAFIDFVLKNGLNLTDTDIACTSFEATGVLPGDNIPSYIKRNISGAKICLSMVSINYKNSGVCMNEVGAAWALGKTPIQIVLPNTSFSELGWLLNTDKAAKIDDEDSLDSLMEVICNKIGNPVRNPKNWNPCKRNLINTLKMISDRNKDN